MMSPTSQSSLTAHLASFAPTLEAQLSPRGVEITWSMGGPYTHGAPFESLGFGCIPTQRRAFRFRFDITEAGLAKPTWRLRVAAVSGSIGHEERHRVVVTDETDQGNLRVLYMGKVQQSEESAKRDLIDISSEQMLSWTLDVVGNTCPLSSSVASRIVYVHGLGSNSACWGSTPEFVLAASGVDYEHFNYATQKFAQWRPWRREAETIRSITQRSHELATRIQDLLADIPSQPIILAAHSMGGLLCRMAISQLFAEGGIRTPDAVRLATFGTPHDGSPVAEVCAIYLRRWVSDDTRACIASSDFIARVNDGWDEFSLDSRIITVYAAGGEDTAVQRASAIPRRRQLASTRAYRCVVNGKTHSELVVSDDANSEVVQLLCDLARAEYGNLKEGYSAAASS